MDIRVLLAKYLTCIIATIVFAQANITIKENTTWSNDRTLSESVNILAGATLTINKGVNISIEFVDLDNDDIGDIEISVEGAIRIAGTKDKVVSIKPDHFYSYNFYLSNIVQKLGLQVSHCPPELHQNRILYF